MDSDRKTVVLVVEDEPIIRCIAVILIEDAGYEVVEARDADQAVVILESRTDIRIVFTDIDMSGSMDGLKLAACVRGRWPPIEIIVTSGHHRQADVTVPNGSVFLQKPYDGLQLVETLQRIAA